MMDTKLDTKDLRQRSEEVSERGREILEKADYEGKRVSSSFLLA
jgi:hypothetical protein